MNENFRSNTSSLLLGGLGGYGAGTISGTGSRTLIVCDDNSKDEHCKWQKFYNKVKIVISLLFLLLMIIFALYYIYIMFFQKKGSRSGSRPKR